MRALLALVIGLAACGSDTSAPSTTSTGGTTATTGGTTGNSDGGAMDLSTAPSPVEDMAVTPSMSPSPSPKPNTGCGTCPNGTSCSSANGIPVCRTPAGIPVFSHVIVIMMENTSLTTLGKSKMTPYLTGLTSTAASASDYHGAPDGQGGAIHPSLPNYLAITSGSPGVQMDGTTPVGCDCNPVGATCNMCTPLNTLITNCNCEQNAMHLGDQLEAVSKTWKDYGEGMGTPCNTMSSGAYAARHVPFVYYQNVQQDPGTRCADHVVDYAGNFATDLAGTLPALSFIAPNLNNDMHGTGIVQTAADITAGDTWLSSNISSMQSSAAYKSGGIIFIVWDEDDYSGVLSNDAPIPLYVLSPYAKSGGYVSPVHANHYSLLATIEDGLGAPRMGGSIGATPLSDFFPSM
jgi:acid phosphatase